MNRILRSALGLVVCISVGAVAAPPSAEAQESDAGCGLCVEAAGTYGTLIGEDFDEEERGFGFELSARHTWASGWGLGVGGRFASLEMHDGVRAGQDLEIASLFVEPRFTLTRDATLRPYVGGRLELLNLEDPDGTDGGYNVGMVGGVDLQVTPEFTLTASAHTSALFFGDDRKGAGRELRFGARLEVLGSGS